jgi:4-amino-4-deoxy-L-arabinose transferase-like glycosyltransferase
VTRTGRSALGAVLVFAAALLAFVPGIRTRVIWTRDEARTALVIRKILETGEWSLTRMPGGVPSKKPPLYHWLAALVAQHGLDETTLRLLAAVGGAGAAALTYLLGAQLATPGVGLMAAAVLIGSPAFFEWARIGRMETLLAFCFTLSLLGIARWLRRDGLVNGLVFGVGGSPL